MDIVSILFTFAIVILLWVMFVYANNTSGLIEDVIGSDPSETDKVILNTIHWLKWGMMSIGILLAGVFVAVILKGIFRRGLIHALLKWGSIAAMLVMLGFLGYMAYKSSEGAKATHEDNFDGSDSSLSDTQAANINSVYRMFTGLLVAVLIIFICLGVSIFMGEGGDETVPDTVYTPAE